MDEQKQTSDNIIHFPGNITLTIEETHVAFGNESNLASIPASMFWPELNEFLTHYAHLTGRSLSFVTYSPGSTGVVVSITSNARAEKKTKRILMDLGVSMREIVICPNGSKLINAFEKFGRSCPQCGKPLNPRNKSNCGCCNFWGCSDCFARHECAFDSEFVVRHEKKEG